MVSVFYGCAFEKTIHKRNGHTEPRALVNTSLNPLEPGSFHGLSLANRNMRFTIRLVQNIHLEPFRDNSGSKSCVYVLGLIFYTYTSLSISLSLLVQFTESPNPQIHKPEPLQAQTLNNEGLLLLWAQVLFCAIAVPGDRGLGV